MQVAVMARSVRPGATGVGRHAASLVRALSEVLAPEELTAFVTQDVPDLGGLQIKQVSAPWPTPNEYTRAFWEQVIVPGQVSKLGIQVYHSPNYILPVARLPCPSVVTVHDLSFLRRRLHRLRSHLYLSLLTGVALRKAAIVIAVSQYTRLEIERRYPHTRGRVVVIYQGIDRIFHAGEEESRSRPVPLSEPYLLFVGTQEPRKNLRRLVQAFEMAVEQHQLPHHLVLVGPKGWKLDDLDRSLADLQLHGRVHRLGYLPDAELVAWYSNADLFVYPSIDEGFGLPVLEAMALGTPVLTSDRAALPEVAGEAAVTADPLDVHALAEAMVSVLTDRDLAHRLRSAGRERAMQFSWREAAERHVEVYRQLVAQGSSG